MASTFTAEAPEIDVPAGRWVRLWCEMPNDPKWRTIAKKARQPVACVIAVFTVLMAQAGERLDVRGHCKGDDDDEIADMLGLTAGKVQAIRAAMQGKVLDGTALLNWDRRQPKGPATNAERQARWRAANPDKAKLRHGKRVTADNAGVTADNAPESESESEEKKISPLGGKQKKGAPVTRPPVAAKPIEPHRYAGPDGGAAMMAKANTPDPKPPATPRPAAKAKPKLSGKQPKLTLDDGEPLAPVASRRIPESWHPKPLPRGSIAAKQWDGWTPDEQQAEVEKFFHHYNALPDGDPKAEMGDWQSQWIAWLHKGGEFGRTGGSGHGRSGKSRRFADGEFRDPILADEFAAVAARLDQAEHAGR